MDIDNNPNKNDAGGYSIVRDDFAGEPFPGIWLLTVAQVLAWLQIGRTTLYEISKKKRLVPLRVEGCLRYHRQAVRDYLRSLQA